jgi:hypothetical protein
MWNTRTVWFDIAVVMSVFAVGNILFGHFEEHKPKALRLLKVGLVVGLTAALSYLGLRWVAYGLISALGLGPSTYMPGGYRATGSTVGPGSRKRSTTRYWE